MTAWSERKIVSSFRVAAVGAVTGLALWLVFRRVDAATFEAALRHLQPGWFLAGVALYGLGLCGAGWRWHQALRLTHCAVHPSASLRGYCIGHFFFTIFLGAAGGDVAKSALYARWYRLPFTQVLAAAPLDRLFGLMGLLALFAVSLVLALFNGGFAAFHPLHWPDWKTWALGGALLMLAAIILVRWQPKSASGWARFYLAFRAGCGRLWSAPGDAMAGAAWGLLAQVAFAVVFALNLQAVAHVPLPWAKIFWVFPVIAVVAALPVTVAGAGLREGAALVLLAFYNVPAADAVAAALLTLAVNLLWAAIGGMLLATETTRLFKNFSRPTPRSLSLVIPTLNEAAALPETIRRARAVPEVFEIIVVDGGSRDATREIATQLDCRVITSPPGRGGQMRAGAAQATGDVIVLLHADTWLPPQAGQAVLAALRDPTVVGGGFWKIFRDAPLLLYGSRWKCAVRFYLGGRVMGDQALFVRREVLEQVGGVPDVPLMEEFELCRRLRRAGRLALAEATVVTSARRFLERGVLRTYLRMWRVMAHYYLGTPAQELRKLYER